MKFISVFVTLAAAAASAQALTAEFHHESQPQHLSGRSHHSHHISHDDQTLSRRSAGHHHQAEDQYLTARSEDILLEFTTRELVEELEARFDIERRGKKMNWIKKKLGFGGGHGSHQQQQQSGGASGASGVGGDDSMDVNGAPTMI